MDKILVDPQIIKDFIEICHMIWQYENLDLFHYMTKVVAIDILSTCQTHFLDLKPEI